MANTKIPSELIADSSITAAKLADGTITTADIADSNVTTAKIADSNVTTAKIGDAQVTTAKITDANVTTGKIADDAVTTAKMASNSVTSDTIASGITLAGTSTFSGNVTLSSTTPVLNVLAGANEDATLILRENGTGIVGAQLIYDGGANEFQFKIGNNSANTAFTIARDTGQTTFAQNATFAGTISASGTLTTGNITVNGDTSGIEGGEIFLAGAGTNEGINIDNYTGIFRIFDGTSPQVRLTLDTSGNAVFAGTISSGAITSTGSIISTGLTAQTGGIAGIADVVSFNASGNGGLGRGTGILIKAPGNSSAVSVARIAGLQNEAAGSANNAALTFQVAASNGTLTERMRIDSSGNVGIGTGSDTLTGKLTVKDSSTLDINLIGNPPELNIEDTSSTSGTKRARFTLDNNKVKIEGLADDDQSVTQSIFVANLSNGNVHIGGTNPEQKLDVEGAIKVGAALQIGSNGTGQIGFNRNTFDGNYYTSGLQRFQINGPMSGSDYLHFQNYNSGGTYLDGIYINGGKVGVGVNAPGEKFEVNGAIAVKGSLIDDRTATGTMDYVSGITRFVAYGGSGSENGQIAFNTAVGGGSSTVKARVSAGFTNTSTTALPAFRTEGSYGGGIGMLDGVSQAGWYQQDSGDTFHHYVGKESSDTPASKIVLTTKSNGHVGIMTGGSAAINHPLHVTREEVGYQVKFDNDNGSAQGLAIRIKANDSGNFNAINTVSASSGSDKTVFNVRDDGIVTTPEQVYFLARRNGHLSGYNMSATSGATTTIFNYVESGQSSAAGTAAFSTTDGTFSAPVDGLYLFHYSLYSNNTIEQAWFTSNGARIDWTDVSANTNGSYTSGVLSVSMQYYMSAGASIRVHPYSSGSSSSTIYENNHHTYWKGILIG